MHNLYQILTNAVFITPFTVNQRKKRVESRFNSGIYIFY